MASAPPVAVVSGASSGIGMATALQLTAQGWHVVALGRLENVLALINCAGHDIGGGVAFHRHAGADWRAILRLNLEATMGLTQACLPAMLAAGRGDIVVIGSITARRATPGLAAYSTSKHALRGFVQALRADYADSGVRVTEIAPGVVRSGFAGRRWPGDPQRAADFYRHFAECLDPGDVARAVCHVLSQPSHVCVTEMVLMPTRERP